MGKGLTEIESPQGFAAETSSTAVLLASSHLGFPLSTTQVCSGSILGAGLGKRLAEVRWTVAGRMALAWLFTLPAAALVGALSGRVANSGNLGVALIAVLAVAAGGAIYLASRRTPVTSNNVNEYPSTPAASSAPAAV
jgi:PiT family inorganic phosphate transporter